MLNDMPSTQLDNMPSTQLDNMPSTQLDNMPNNQENSEESIVVFIPQTCYGFITPDTPANIKGLITDGMGPCNGAILITGNIPGSISTNTDTEGKDTYCFLCHADSSTNFKDKNNGIKAWIDFVLNDYNNRRTPRLSLTPELNLTLNGQNTDDCIKNKKVLIKELGLKIYCTDNPAIDNPKIDNPKIDNQDNRKRKQTHFEQIKEVLQEEYPEEYLEQYPEQYTEQYPEEYSEQYTKEILKSYKNEASNSSTSGCGVFRSSKDTPESKYPRPSRFITINEPLVYKEGKVCFIKDKESMADLVGKRDKNKKIKINKTEIKIETIKIVGDSEKINGSENVLNPAITMTNFYAQETREPGLIFDGREAIESLESVLDNPVINLQKDIKEEEINEIVEKDTKEEVNEIAKLMDKVFEENSKILLSKEQLETPLFKKRAETEQEPEIEDQFVIPERSTSVIPKRLAENISLQKNTINKRSNSTPITQVEKLKTIREIIGNEQQKEARSPEQQ